MHAPDARELEVRVADPSDLAQIDALLARSYPRLLARDYPPSVLVTAIPLIARANPRLVASGSYFVALEAGRVVGAGGWTAAGPQGQHAAGSGHVRHFATDVDRQRRGIGRALMDRVIAAARASGATRLECQSTRTAVSFYRAMGFEIEGPITVPLRQGIDFPAISMTRDLAGGD